MAKKRPERRKQRHPQDSGLRAGRRESCVAREGRIAPKRGGFRSWLIDKGPILQFALVFGLLLAGFNAFFYLWFSKSSLFDSYLSFNPRCSAAVLRVFGDDVTVNGTSVISSRFSVEVARGYDAIHASAFLFLAYWPHPREYRFSGGCRLRWWGRCFNLR